MTLTVEIPDIVGRRLRERASLDGQAVEEYVLHLIERDTTEAEVGKPGSGPVADASEVCLGGDALLSGDEFDLLLDDLASGPELPHLPADFSRADLYTDHD